MRSTSKILFYINKNILSKSRTEVQRQSEDVEKSKSEGIYRQNHYSDRQLRNFVRS